ncbi:hypothetical protein [Agromyces sp. M3QZ16-3]|uniref:hypothetical protein n=1 Tax=Agromyces sp. M3QZ16-3 TaxID=3447585 RepID=UPI003F68DF16
MTGAGSPSELLAWASLLRRLHDSDDLWLWVNQGLLRVGSRHRGLSEATNVIWDLCSAASSEGNLDPRSRDL